MQTGGFDYFAQLAPDAVAVIEPGGTRRSRRELFELSNRLARALRGAGLRSGATIAIVSPNCFEYLAVYLAATQIGLYLVPINWHFAKAEIDYILRDCEAQAVIVHERLGAGLLATVRQSAIRTVCLGAAPGLLGLSDFLADYDAGPLEDTLPGRVMSYTSATTGRPKGVLLPLPESGAALDRIIQLHIDAGVSLGGHVHLCGSMLYHAAPLEGAAIALHMGHIVVLLDRWEPEALLRTIEEHGVTTAFMPPVTFVRMLKLPDDVRGKYRTSSLQRVVHTGARCPTEIKRRMIEWWGPIFWDTYGAAEGAGTIVGSEEWLRYPGTVGKALPGSRIKILNAAGEEVPPGEAGTIYMTRHTGDRFEYKGDPQKTRARYRGDFFTVDDTGYLNEQGYLFLCDREVDLIISGGMNIYPAEIEQILILHPQVADCAVLGVPDELFGEAVHAIVQAERGAATGPRLTLDILEFLSEHISQAKLPRRVHYADSLPRDPTGKLFKRLLRERYAPMAGATRPTLDTAGAELG
jgi:long-chain acyl-CoA synthetase